ncbi:ABC transporter permease [Oenococcus oeni]|nr:ABC transporter permease [Oenococcus oeni]EAV40015.1 ABC-type oligopeptide transport system, integral membrane protein [Oenococcus oeni ATCC BAA-1163]KGO16993.1 peptide ABC transporter permease [Oenococcus oeni X2L]AAL76998.1 OppB [Oenococcus oeni]ABI34104.1 OptB [Oenococcus oeni]AVI94001.1 peptide ABC transporter permease [Oenococcus oeni]
MAKYILKRILMMVLTVFIVTALTFVMMQWMPGSPFNNPKLSASQIAQLSKQYGLSKPIWQQFLNYLVNAAHFNFGTSYINTGQSVSLMISQRLPVSMELGIQALILGVPLGMYIGTYQAMRKNTARDYSLSIITLFFTALPDFLLGMLLMLFFAIDMPIFPITGWNSWMSSVLPTLALGMGVIAFVARFTRSQTLETLDSDQIQLAYAKGLDEGQVIMKHAVRNSLIPVLTLLGPLTAGLLTGSALIETIFSIPGIGNQFVSSISSKDYPVIMGTTIVYTILLQVMILLGDIATAIADPRIRLGGKD